MLPRGPEAAPGTPGFAWYYWQPEGEFDAEAFTTSLDALDDLLDEACEEQGFAAGPGRRRRLLAGRRADARAWRCGRSDRPRPAGVLAMSPALPGLDIVRARLGGRADVPVLIQHGDQDPLVPVAARPPARPGARRATACPSCTREYPMGHQVALESIQARPGVARRGARGRAARASRCPTTRPRARCKAVTTATFPTEVLQSPTAGDRRLLGAVVRAVPPGRSDRRADRGDARGRLQGREGEHRRGARARAAVRGAEHPADRAVPERPARARRRSAPSPGPSSKPSSGCSSSRSAGLRGLSGGRLRLPHQTRERSHREGRQPRDEHQRRAASRERELRAGRASGGGARPHRRARRSGRPRARPSAARAR